MTANLMNGTYYEFGGSLSEDLFINLNKSDMTDKEAKQKAANEERFVYKNTYDNGKRIASVKVYDPYDDGFYLVDTDNLYYEPLPEDMQFRYQMLGRLRSDCEYFLGNGYGFEGHLWAGSVEEQITEMRNRWNEFEADEKPEWLTMQDIEDYEMKMLEAREWRKEQVV